MYDECPISKLFVPNLPDIYKLIKATLGSEFGVGVPPSKLLEELNIYFVYLDAITSAESDFNRIAKDK